MATAAISQPTQATYGSYGVVTILERTRTLVRVLTNNELEFWVKAEKLKPVRQPKKKAEPEAAAASADEFVNGLLTSHYRLWVEVRDAECAAIASNDYESWAGEPLPDTCLLEYPKRTNKVEWRLRFPQADNMRSPFPLIEAGQVGKRPAGTGSVCGYVKQGIVTVNYRSEIERLVRAGLRAAR